MPSLPYTPEREHRARQLTFEAGLAELPQEEWDLTHHFARGLYGREMFIKGGTVLTGKIHRHEHLVVVLQGRVTIYTVNGPRTVTAPDIFVSPPGTKRVAIAHEDTRWLTIEATAETDLRRIEDEMIVSDPLEWDELAQAAAPVTEDLSAEDIE